VSKKLPTFTAKSNTPEIPEAFVDIAAKRISEQ
jgi:hypothetical protein